MQGVKDYLSSRGMPKKATEPTNSVAPVKPSHPKMFSAPPPPKQTESKPTEPPKQAEVKIEPIEPPQVPDEPPKASEPPPKPVQVPEPKPAPPPFKTEKERQFFS